MQSIAMQCNDLIGVADQMRAALPDEPPWPLELDGKRRYFGRKKKSWYRLREIRTRAGTPVVVGGFGNFKDGTAFRVDVDWKGITADEREHLQQQRAAAAERERTERATLARLASATAAEMWHAASPAGRSPYIDRKGVQPEACRYLWDGSLLVPLVRYDLPRAEALKGVQRIKPDGSKLFTKGFEKTGAACRLGLVVHGQPILICEGYATGLTLRMATDRRLPVFVALDAGNLQPVAEILARLFPDSKLLLCADDDWLTAGNPGRSKAWAAARALPGAMVTYPIFRPGNRGRKDTDFNDLHAREGVAMVTRQLRMVLPMLSMTVVATGGARAA